MDKHNREEISWWISEVAIAIENDVQQSMVMKMPQFMLEVQTQALL